MLKPLVGLFLWLLCIQDAVSIRCHVHGLTPPWNSSTVNKECTVGDLPLLSRATFLLTKPEDYRCYKFTLEYAGDDELVARGCMLKETCKLVGTEWTIEKKNRLRIVTTACYECDKDDCNGATKTTAVGLGLILLSIGLVL